MVVKLKILKVSFWSYSPRFAKFVLAKICRYYGMHSSLHHFASAPPLYLFKSSYLSVHPRTRFWLTLQHLTAPWKVALFARDRSLFLASYVYVVRLSWVVYNCCTIPYAAVRMYIDFSLTTYTLATSYKLQAQAHMCVNCRPQSCWWGWERGVNKILLSSPQKGERV